MSAALAGETELVMELEVAIPVIGMETAGEIAGDAPGMAVAAVEATTTEADFDEAIGVMLLLVSITDIMMSLKECYMLCPLCQKCKNGKAQKIHELS